MTSTQGHTGPAEHVDLSLQQFEGAWRLMCAAAPGHELMSDEGLFIAFSGCPVPFFNVALPTGASIGAEDLRSLGERAVAYASDRPVPWLFVVTHERLAPGVDAAAALERSGLAPIMPLTGMLAGHVASRDIPAGLSLALASTDHACEAAVAVNSLAYEMDLSAAKPLVGRRAFWDDHHLVTGSVEGKVVCSAAVMMVDGYRYVALVATEPAFQRRGFGDAAMRRALDVAAAAHGPAATVLHATDAGRPVYERMGYVPISSHTLYMEQRFLAAH